jgi:hypothetical protein
MWGVEKEETVSEKGYCRVPGYFSRHLRGFAACLNNHPPVAIDHLAGNIRTFIRRQEKS